MAEKQEKSFWNTLKDNVKESFQPAGAQAAGRPSQFEIDRAQGKEAMKKKFLQGFNNN